MHMRTYKTQEEEGLATVASSFLGLDIRNIGSDMASFMIIWEQQNEGYTGRCMEILGVKDKGETLEELKANMTEAITSALRSMKKESEEWGGKEMVIELSV
jgi:predicted RNase H-like HicB family nuclease